MFTEISDLGPLRAGLGDASRLYPWSVPVWMDRDSKAATVPFSMGKWRTKSPEACRQQVRSARQAGAAGVIVHEFYWHFFIDSAGEDLGFGPLPQRQYWETLRG